MHHLLLAVMLAAGQLHFDDLGGTLVVRATVNRRPLNLVFDLGAGTTIISRAAAARLALTGYGSKVLSNSGPRDVTATSVSIALIQLGRASVRNVEAVVTDLPPDLTYQGHYGTIDGILGYTFFKDFTVTIDYDTHTIDLTKPNEFHPPAASQALHMSLLGGTPVVDGTIDGVPAGLELDSGNNGVSFMSLKMARIANLPNPGCPAVGDERVGVGGRRTTIVTRAPLLTVGSLSFRDVTVAISGNGSWSGPGKTPDVVLGNALLRQMHLSIDYDHRVVYATASRTFGRRAPYFDTGIQLVRLTDGTLNAHYVQSGSLGSRAGVRTGDTIATVDGRPASQIDDEDIARAFRRETISYGVERGARSFVATLRLVDALPPCRNSASARSSSVPLRTPHITIPKKNQCDFCADRIGVGKPEVT